MKCSVYNCKKDKTAKGYCYNHYYSFRTYGSPLAVEENKSLEVKIKGKVVYIELTNGGYALVDVRDYKKVQNYRWSMAGRGYAIGNNKKRKLAKMHHLVMNKKHGYEIDHINLNKLDNRRSNLRYVTHSINTLNGPLRSTNKSGHRGVCYWWRDGGWRAYAVVDNKQIHLGYFKNKEEAIEARLIFEKENNVI